MVCHLVVREVCEAAHGVGRCGSESAGHWDGAREGDDDEAVEETSECCF